MIISESWTRIGAALLILGPGAVSIPAQIAGSPASQHQPSVKQGGLSGDSAALAAEAQSALSKGDYAGAATSLERLAKLQPGVAEVHADLAVAYYSAGRYGDAIKQGREALTLKPSLVHAHFFLGASLAEGGQCKDALPYLEKDYTRATEPQLKRVLGTDAVR